MCMLSTSENHDQGKESPAINTTEHWRLMDDPRLKQKVKQMTAFHYEGILITRSQITKQAAANINRRYFGMPRA